MASYLCKSRPSDESRYMCYQGIDVEARNCHDVNVSALVGLGDLYSTRSNLKKLKCL